MPHGRLGCPLWSSFVLSLVLAVPVSGCGGDVRQTGPSPANPLDSTEEEILSALNTYRSEVGAPVLTGCKSLNVSASAHADDMRNKGYLSDQGQDGSTTRERACEAGYTPACESASVAELIARGSAEPAHTLDQWKKDAESDTVVRDPVYTKIGVGLSVGGEQPVWTLDLGSDEDESCP